MEFITSRNAVVLALTQTGVIVMGTLSAGACIKWYSSLGLTPHLHTQFLAEYGFLLLLVPLGWISYSVWVQKQSLCEPFPQGAGFFVGIVLLFLLLLLVTKAALLPWLVTVFQGQQGLAP